MRHRPVSLIFKDTIDRSDNPPLSYILKIKRLMSNLYPLPISPGQELF